MQWEKNDGRDEARCFEELVSAPLCHIIVFMTEMLGVHVYVSYWCYAMCVFCDVWWVMNRQMVHTSGFHGADMPTWEIQTRMEALHECVCLLYMCMSVCRKETASHISKGITCCTRIIFLCFIRMCTEASKNILLLLLYFGGVGDFEFRLFFCCALGSEDEVCFVVFSSVTEVITCWQT